MLHRVLALLTVLSLLLAPGLAAAQGAAPDHMGHGEHQAMQHHGHAQDAAPCGDTAGCAKRAALCAWICAGSTALPAEDLPQPARRVARDLSAVPVPTLPKGLTPAPETRPPNPFLL